MYIYYSYIDILIIFHCITHRTAGRQRGEDKSLFFEIIPPYPLLTISLKGLEFLNDKRELQLLQGEILHTKIIIKNNGKAPAFDLFLKLSHPSFVFEKCAPTTGPPPRHSPSTPQTPTGFLPQNPLIPLWGKSSTISKFLEINEIILPGEEKASNVWIRLTELGQQQVSILATYKSYKENVDGVNGTDELIDGDGEVSTPLGTSASTGAADVGPKGRIAFHSFQVNVLPSVDLTVRAVGGSSAGDERMLMVKTWIYICVYMVMCIYMFMRLYMCIQNDLIALILFLTLNLTLTLAFVYVGGLE